MSLLYKTIKPLLSTGGNTASRWLSYIGLGIGMLLLLCSLQMFVNIQQLLNKNNVRKNGFDFISVSKMITNQNMGRDNRFTQSDIQEMRSQPFIDGVAPLLPSRFEVVAEAGNTLPFSSDIFVEALDNNFLDTVPPGFTWKEGQEVVPIIFSSDLLEMYNVFAPGYDLPQMSPATASNIRISLRCQGSLGEMVFHSNIVAFSDRVSSLLVPESFLTWANKALAGVDSVKPSRVFIKTKDANNDELIKFLDTNNYRINKEKTMFGRSKQLLQGIVAGLGIFGLMVILLALMLFSFYLQLIIARSRDNLQLLLTLGYSPSWLSKNLTRQFVIVYFFVVLVALAICQLIQWAFHHFIMYDRPELSSFIYWGVVAAAAFLILLSILINYRLVKKSLQKIF